MLCSAFLQIVVGNAKVYTSLPRLFQCYIATSSLHSPSKFLVPFTNAAC